MSSPGETFGRTRQSLGMARALQMSVLQVLIFLLFWTPYTLMATWYAFYIIYIINHNPIVNV